MMNTDTSSDTPQSEIDSQPQPGRDLAAARERAGIGRDDMAARLRLRQTQLDALERDDYAELPPPTFVRGYLRAYARELELDPEAVVADYATRTSSGDNPELLTRAGMEHSHTGGPGVWLGLLLIVLVVGGGAGAWWYQHRLVDRDGAAVEDTANRDTETSVEAGTEVGETPGDEQQAQNDRTDGATSVDMGQDSTAEADAASNGTSPSDAESVSASDTVTADSGTGSIGRPGEAESSSVTPEESVRDESPARSEGDLPNEAEASTGESAPGTAADEAAATASGTEAADDTGSQGTDSNAASGGSTGLVLTFDGRSWVEVRDANDRKLAYTLYHDAAPLKLQGKPPFRIYLGNARAVQVSLNGESVDMQRFIRDNNTARIVVDESGARAR